MKTVVVQSFRTNAVPKYVSDCCASVRDWARAAGYAYAFYDDAFLELVPSWYRRKAGGSLCVVADLARLIVARQRLASYFDRVVWCDADLLIFCPERLTLGAQWTGAYCREVWLHRDASGGLVPEFKVNNSMCVFTTADLAHLDEYITRCCNVVEAATDAVGSLSVGTSLLTAEYAARALISGVAMISPHLMTAILGDDETTLDQYRSWQGSPMVAANLCNALRPGFGEFSGLFDYLCDGVVERLRNGLAGERLSQAG